jgi:hypothetical protein
MTQEKFDMVASVGGWAGAAAAVGAAALYVRRILSRDQTEIQENRVERDQLVRLERENVRLNERLEIVTTAGVQRPQDAIAIASLEAENRALMRDIRRAVRRLPPEVVEELETDFAALANVEERIEPQPKR